MLMNANYAAVASAAFAVPTAVVTAIDGKATATAATARYVNDAAAVTAAATAVRC